MFPIIIIKLLILKIFKEINYYYCYTLLLYFLDDAVGKWKQNCWERGKGFEVCSQVLGERPADAGVDSLENKYFLFWENTRKRF